MSRHPTIAMIRMLSVAPVIAANWSVECSDDAPSGADEMVKEQLVPLRPLILQEAMLHGLIDYGWCAFEKIFDQDSKGAIQLTRLKPLLHDISTIMVGMKGEFAGIRQTGPLAHVVDLDVEKCMLHSFNVEGTNWYGQPRMESARITYNKWTECDVGAARYDKKIAGSHWVIYYPPGYTGDEFLPDGVTPNPQRKDNYDIALGILASIEASGSMIVPSTTVAFLDELNQSTAKERAWCIEFIEDKGGKQANFINRLRYLDSLLARALITPERAVLEGQFGTKAESGIHSDAASTAMDLEHQHVARVVNWHLVNQLLRLNYGPDAENTVWVTPAPMDDTSIQFLRDLYKGFVTGQNQQIAADEYPNIDKDALRERIGVPYLDEDEREELDVEPTETELPQMLRGIIASQELSWDEFDAARTHKGLPVKKWVPPPDPGGANSGNKAGGYCAMGITNTEFGDEVEAAVNRSFGMKSAHPDRRQGPLDSVKGKDAYEIKACTQDAGEYKAKPKADEVQEKLAYAKKNKLTPHTMIVVYSKAEKRLYVYSKPGIGAYRLTGPENGWKFHGKLKLDLGAKSLSFFMADPVDTYIVDHDPTVAQKDAGNYRKAHVKVYGLSVTVENPAGSVRRGQGWATTMPYHYGYVRGTKGLDGDHVDVILGPDLAGSGSVYVISLDPQKGGSDEKCMLGFDSVAQALNGFDDCYEAGLGPMLRTGVKVMSIDGWKRWLQEQRPVGAGDPPPELRRSPDFHPPKMRVQDKRTLPATQTDNDSTTSYTPKIVRVQGDPDDHVAYGTVGEQVGSDGGYHLLAHCETGERKVMHSDTITVLRAASDQDLRKAGIGSVPPGMAHSRNLLNRTPTPGADPGSLAKDTRRYGGGIGDYPAGGWAPSTTSKNTQSGGVSHGSSTYAEAAIRQLGIGLSNPEGINQYTKLKGAVGSFDDVSSGKRGALGKAAWLMPDGKTLVDAGKYGGKGKWVKAGTHEAVLNSRPVRSALSIPEGLSPSQEHDLVTKSGAVRISYGHDQEGKEVSLALNHNAVSPQDLSEHMDEGRIPETDKIYVDTVGKGRKKVGYVTRHDLSAARSWDDVDPKKSYTPSSSTRQFHLSERLTHADPDDLDISGCSPDKKKVKQLRKKYQDDPDSVEPPVVKKDGVTVIDGHHHVKAARKAGLKSIPIVMQV